MSVIKILQDGRVTIPKHIRDTLGLKQGDVAEAELENGRIVITPDLSTREVRKSQPKLANISAWDEFQRVMDSVHEKNEGVSEAKVSADVQRAIAELRQEEYEE
jgi:AbrB family looped-hinge helix DNA binding protein